MRYPVDREAGDEELKHHIGGEDQPARSKASAQGERGDVESPAEGVPGAADQFHRTHGAPETAGGNGHGDHGGQKDTQAVASAPEATVDPVGGEAVRTAQALTSVYQGKIYYFASKENRDRFEAAPQEYAHKAAGHAVRPAEATNEPPRRRGC